MIRKAAAEDMPALLSLYAAARVFMAQTGNPHQWGSTTPTEEQLRQDIARGELYMAEDETGLLGAFVFFTRPEPTYAVIDGVWHDNTPYGTLHRVASSGRRPRFFDLAADFAKAQIPHLRIDTHADNKVMQNAVARNGFVFCGTITLANGDPRMAFEWKKL